MPTTRKRRSRAPNVLSPIALDDMLHGLLLIPGCGYALEGCQLDRARMAMDWKRHRAHLLPEWIRERPGTRPYAWWLFDAPEVRSEDESERDYLERHGLLTDEDLIQSEAHA